MLFSSSPFVCIRHKESDIRTLNTHFRFFSIKSMKKIQIYSAALIALLFSQTACGQTYVADSPKANTNVADGECQPLEKRTPNAEEQKRSFPEQTRACAVSTKTELEVSEIATGLSRPWAVEPLPDGDFLVTEKGGNLRIVSKDGKISEPLKGILAVGQGGVTEDSKLGGLPPVTARGQGGLLDVALSPKYESDKTIFWSFSETREEGSGTSVARGVLKKEKLTVEDVKVIFRALPSYRNGLHFGSRIAFDKEGLLYVTTGDRFDRPNRAKVQTLDNHYGKVMRIKVDGSVPEGNPFADKKDAKPEIWTLGHRNIQSAVFDGDGRLWTVEHGARGGDELNLIEKGKNYGWSIVTFGQEYSGRKIPNSKLNVTDLSTRFTTGTRLSHLPEWSITTGI